MADTINVLFTYEERLSQDLTAGQGEFRSEVIKQNQFLFSSIGTVTLIESLVLLVLPADRKPPTASEGIKDSF